VSARAFIAVIGEQRLSFNSERGDRNSLVQPRRPRVLYAIVQSREEYTDAT
jgi:hypothetical protein